MAEAVMRHKVERAGLQHLITVDSAGTGTGISGKDRIRTRAVFWTSTGSGTKASKPAASPARILRLLITWYAWTTAISKT